MDQQQQAWGMGYQHHTSVPMQANLSQATHMQTHNTNTGFVEAVQTAQVIRVSVSVGVDDEDALGASPFIVPCYESDNILSLKNEILSRCVRMPTGNRITQVLPENQRPACWLIHKQLGELNDRDSIGDVCRDGDNLLAIFNQKDNVPTKAAHVGKLTNMRGYVPNAHASHNQIPAIKNVQNITGADLPINTAPKKVIRGVLSVKLCALVMEEREKTPFRDEKDFQNRIKLAGGRLGENILGRLAQSGMFGQQASQNTSTWKEQNTNTQNQSSSDDFDDGDEPHDQHRQNLNSGYDPALMAFIFRGKRTPTDIVRSCLDELAQLEKKKDPKTREKNLEEIAKHIQSMKVILCGDGDAAPAQDQVALLANEICHQDLLSPLIQSLVELEFEAKKDIVIIYSTVLRRQIGTRFPTVEYLTTKKSDVLNMLLKGYESQQIMLSCGQMLRDSIQFSDLANLLLESPFFFKFFEYVEMSSFDGASDAFATFKALLTQHKQLSASFLDRKYVEFFRQYTELLSSKNYVTRRQSLKLLGEILLDRAYFNIMTRYISDEANLKIIMILLRDKFPTIQFEAFHVFKVFVANPRKPPEIINILQRNRERLVQYLQTLQSGRGEDESFNEEKQVLIREISSLPRLQ